MDESGHCVYPFSNEPQPPWHRQEGVEVQDWEVWGTQGPLSMWPHSPQPGYGTNLRYQPRPSP